MTDQELSVPQDDPSFTITHLFDAPRQLIWECYTNPVHMVQFWGPHGSTTPVCEVDLRPGGVWRTVMRFASGDEYGYSSVYLEIAAPERLIYRDAPDNWGGGLEGLPPVELHSTIILMEKDGRTQMTLTVKCPDVKARDAHIAHGFANMVAAGNARLATYIQTLQVK